MPQIILEYSSNIIDEVNQKEVFDEVHQILNAVGSVDLYNCKSRAINHVDYYIGDGNAKHAFVHLEVRLLEGRSDELKGKIGTELLNKIKSHFPKSFEELQLQITVELSDIKRAEYFKVNS